MGTFLEGTQSKARNEVPPDPRSTLHDYDSSLEASQPNAIDLDLRPGALNRCREICAQDAQELWNVRSLQVQDLIGVDL